MTTKIHFSSIQYEIETTEGLEFITQQELIPFIQNKVIRDVHIQKGAIQCICSRPEILYRLKTAVSVYVCVSYAVPRPKALLGHEHFSRILKTIEFVRENMDTPCKTFYISAAGSDSSVMERIKSEIASATGLLEAEQGDMLLRIRRSKHGWDVLTRLTNRPLATRAWRVCNMEGALNAPVA
ncbi:MAG: RNA methyltransferase, partial [Anaerolineae bacterium]|nr:RNA methyltransferase [Anaerolineae bacterium]